jgi:2'-5' RNA ligase
MTSGSEPSQRLFFALWPSAELRSEIAQYAQEPCRAAARRVVPAANLHVTLRFLGAVPTSVLPQIMKAGDAVRASGFELVFDQLELWPRPQALVLVASRVPEMLRTLVDHLQISSLHSQLTAETQDFRPHVTLARRVIAADTASLAPPCIAWRATEFVLVESKPDRNGSSYTVLQRWPLA